MRRPVDNWNAWYIAQGFGVKTTYGFHEGVDLNLKTGGDTDLGQLLLAVADGEITSVHDHTGKPTFGLHLHLKFDSPFGPRWAHYAHLQSVSVKVGDRVTEGQPIAKLGKSGTDVAHCHFAIKNQATGIDGLAKTEEDLAKWEDPIAFIDRCIEKIAELVPPPATPQAEAAGDDAAISAYRNFIDDLVVIIRPPMDRQDMASLLGEMQTLKTTADNHDQFVREIADLVSSPTNDEEAVKEAVETQIGQLSSDVFEIKKKKLTEFTKADLLSALVYKVFSRS